MSKGILLDSHVLIWLADATLPDASLAVVLHSRLVGQAYVSPVTAWEIGLLAGRRRRTFEPDPVTWYERLIGDMKLAEVALTSRILLDSTLLPGDLPDPADRMLIATARALGCALMTRDAAILAYAAQGHCKVVPC
ncbi:MAG: type II toxin-antitoxin system VapC family toxin [Novosphingobium sp.]